MIRMQLVAVWGTKEQPAWLKVCGPIWLSCILLLHENISGENNIGCSGFSMLMQNQWKHISNIELSNGVSDSIQPIQAMSLSTVNWPSWTQISVRTANLKFNFDVCRIVYQRFISWLYIDVYFLKYTLNNISILNM